MSIISGYTGILDDIHVTTLVGEIFGIPLTPTSFDISKGGEGTQRFDYQTQRDSAFDQIKALMAYPNLEARVLKLVGDWTSLPPAGEVEKDGATIPVEKARCAIRDAVRSVYGIMAPAWDGRPVGL